MVSQEVRVQGPSNLPTQVIEQDILQGSRAKRSRHDLWKYLARVRRAGLSRYKRMRRALIDLNELTYLAEDVLDDRTTTATNSSSSLPRSRRSAPRNPVRSHYHEPSTQIRARRKIPETVPVDVQDFVYGQTSPERHPQDPRDNRYPRYHDQPEQPVQEPVSMQMPQSFKGIGREFFCPEPRTQPAILRPQPQQNIPHPRQYHDHSELPPRRPIPTQTARQIVPVIADDVAYNHPPLSLRTRDGAPSHGHPNRERRPIQQAPPSIHLQPDRSQEPLTRGRSQPHRYQRQAFDAASNDRPTTGRGSTQQLPPPSYYPQEDRTPFKRSYRSRSCSADYESLVEDILQPPKYQKPTVNTVPIHMHPTPERGATQPPPPTSHHPHGDLRQYHSSIRSRSRSIDRDSGVGDVLEPSRHRRTDGDDRRYPPNSYKDPERPRKLRKRSRSRSDSAYGSVSGRSSDAEDRESMRSRSGSSSLSRDGSRNRSIQPRERPSEIDSQLEEDHSQGRRRRRSRSIRD